MSDHNPGAGVTAQMQPVTDEPVTSELLLPGFGDEGVPPDPPSPLGEEDWPSQVAKPGVRLRLPTAILCALFLAAAGLWGGSVLQKKEGGSTATGGLSAGARSALSRLAGSNASTGSPFGSGANATTGTVTDIIGNTLYVTNASGNLVRVKLSSSATVTRNATSSLSGLKPGDTVTIQGTTPVDGSMTASSVAATAAGVKSIGRAGGFGNGLGGSAASSSASN
jgi:hypothetical protein